MGVLDVTNPEAAAHLQGFVNRIVSWGYGLLKIDFLFAGAYEGGRSEPVTGMQAYRRALDLIRQAAGEDVVLVAVGAPGPPSFPTVDAWRLGGDIAFDAMGPAWPFIANQARMVAARWPLCRATLCDADPPLLRALSDDEVQAGAWVVALAGGALMLSDDLRALDAERLDWLFSDPQRLQASTSGETAIPRDLFPADPPAALTSVVADILGERDAHVVPRTWTGNFEGQVLFNAGAEPFEVDGTVVSGHAVVWVPSR